MKTYYIGMLVFDVNDVDSTEVFLDHDDCEEHCRSITDNYYVIQIDLNIKNPTLN